MMCSHSNIPFDVAVTLLYRFDVGAGHEGRLQDNIAQLEQDCIRLENMARKELPRKKQEVKM